MSNFLLEKLDLPKIYLKRNKPEGYSENDPLSFYDMLRVMFIDRDLSYPGILREVFETKRKEIIRVMMGLTTPKIAEIENEERDLKIRRAELVSEISALRNLMENMNVPTLMDIEIEKNKLITQLEALKKQEESLRDNARNNAQAKLISDGKNSYNELRQELIEKRRLLENLEQEKLNLNHQNQRMNELRSVLESEVKRINRHLLSQHVISTFTFTNCPRCLQTISTNMRQREVDDNCMLCGREIESQAYDDAAWQKALRDVGQSKKETDELLTNIEKRLQEIQNIENGITERLSWLEQNLAYEVDLYVSPIIENMSLNIAEITAIEKELSQLEYKREQQKYAIYLAEEKLPNLIRELEIIERRLEAARNEIGTVAERHYSFLTHFRKFMRGVQLNKEFHSADWDENEQLPTINGQKYTNVMSGPDLALTVLGFYYSLLAMSVAEPKVTTNHPKLLIIDEPEQQKMGKLRLRQVLNLFGQLAIENVEHIQVIIATALEDIPREFEDYALEI